MKWSDLKEQIGKFAPLIGTVVGGPAGATIGALVASGLGVENTPDAVSQAIKSDPNAAIKLKQIEAENEQHLRDSAFKILNAELKDKQDARKNHKHSVMPAIICCALTLMVLLGGYAIFMAEIPETNKTLANLLFGALLAKWGDSIAYWVGTTRSSAEKTILSAVK